MASLSVAEQLKQLDDARKLVLGDATYYPQIIQSILPIIGPDARVELRRWGADFLSETFASPIVPAQQKETLSLIVLETLKSMLDNTNEDTWVQKSVVQTAASIYPLVFKWIINNPYDSPTWERMTAIKSRIFRIWDTAAPGIRICCIKFSQRVVLVQTTGIEAETKQADPLNISLSLVPQSHPLIPPRNLEAEASGLLDRMLGVFQENASDAVIVNATLNSLSILIRARPPIASKILNAILNFNPLKLANSPMTPKLRVMAKSMEKTTRMLLIHVNKRDPQNPLAVRIHQQVERLMRSRTEIFDEANRKRGATEPPSGLDSKRQRIDNGTSTSSSASLYIPPLGPGSHSVAELFTITNDEGLKAFDVGQLSEDLIVKIGVTILSHLDDGVFGQAVNGVRERLLAMTSPENQLPALNPYTAPLGVDDDDDDYEPDFQVAEDTEQILNKLDNAPPGDSPLREPEVTLGTFTMPPPPQLTRDEVSEIGRNTVLRVFGVMQTLEDPTLKKNKAGLNRLAASSYDRDAWITLITRLATRAPAGLDGTATHVKVEEDSSLRLQQLSLSNTIRESLYHYVIEDFRKRIDIAVSWLCEEWYNDKLQIKIGSETAPHYEKWVLRVLDGMMPYLDARDKVLTRFLSEVPGLNKEVLERVKGLCRDPAMINLALTSLLYLVMMRPPAREMALDAVEDVWRTYADARPMAGKYLTKWRPGFVEREGNIKEVGNGDLLPQNGVAIKA